MNLHCGSGHASFEVVVPSGKELIWIVSESENNLIESELTSNVQRLTARHCAKESLAAEDSQPLVPDIDEHVISSVEGAERKTPPHFAQLECLLCAENCLLQLLTCKLLAISVDYPDCTLFAYNHGVQAHCPDGILQRALCDVQEPLNVLVGPLYHFFELPVHSRD